MDYEVWMNDARRSIDDNIAANQSFELKSLFQECVWTQLTKGERINFGKFFANEVREGKISGIEHCGRKKDNHTKYIKRRSAP